MAGEEQSYPASRVVQQVDLLLDAAEVVGSDPGLDTLVHSCETRYTSSKTCADSSKLGCIDRGKTQSLIQQKNIKKMPMGLLRGCAKIKNQSNKNI